MFLLKYIYVFCIWYMERKFNNIKFFRYILLLLKRYLLSLFIYIIKYYNRYCRGEDIKKIKILFWIFKYLLFSWIEKIIIGRK